MREGGMQAGADWTAAHVRAVEDVAQGVRLVEIVPADSVRAYAPGAHLRLVATIGETTDTRSYSLVGAEPVAGAYRIAVKRQAQSRGGSAYVWSLRPGDPVRIAHPANLFALAHGRPGYLLVAGGIGITPIVGMAEALARRGASVRLAYAGRARAEMPFLDHLEGLLGPRLAVHVSEEGSRLDLAAAIAGLHPEGEMYLCGPMRLIEAARAAWAEAGRPAAALRYETFGSSGRFVAQPFVVRVPRLGLEVVVPETKTMLDALQEAGADLLSDCRRGECGLCALDVLSVEGEVDHRDVFFSDEEKRSNHKICACVSRAVAGVLVVDTADR